MIRAIASLVIGLWVMVGMAIAQSSDFSALSRVIMEQSSLKDTRRGVTLSLGMSQGVPCRAYTLQSPPRLVLDFREVDWSGLDHAGFLRATRAVDLRYGVLRPGWSRMVVELDGPMPMQSAEMDVRVETGAAVLKIALGAADAERFAATSGAPVDPRWDLPKASITAPPRRAPGEGPLRVVLDPGHGGIDPGAERDGLSEKGLMLMFARELSESLLRSGQFEVVLTRSDDSFVSLERRVEIAHQVEADVFVSLHADALAEGRALGATVHLLSKSASDEGTALLAERHERDELLSGVDLSGQGDEVASILMDLARTETQPRAERLAKALVGGISDKGLELNSRPIRSGSFSVLKAADIPSVLIEVGFMSSPRDLANLRNPNWRARMALALRDGLLRWRVEDAALSGLVRQ